MFLLKKEQQFTNAQMQPGETLFQYLKRKKQLALKQSLEKQRIMGKQRQLENISKVTTFINQKKSQQSYVLDSARSRPSTKRKQRKSSSKKKRHVNSSVQSHKNSKRQKQNNFSLMNILDNDIFKDEKTTRRAPLHSRNDFKNVSINLEKKKSIDEEEKVDQNIQPRSRSPFRSFISMISPLKNRCQNNLSLSLSQNKYLPKKNINNQQRNDKANTLVKTAQFSTKKTIKQAISKVEKHYNKQVEFQQTMRQKIKEFILTINSFLVHIEDDLNQLPQGSQKKASLIKSQMKIINNFMNSHFKEDQNKNISNLIESMYEQINQTLNDYEGKVNKNSETSVLQSIEKMKQQYEQKIQQLNKEKQRLGRQVGAVNKQNSKLIRDYDNLLEKYNTILDSKQKMENVKKSQQNEIKELYEEQIYTLTQKNTNLQDSVSHLTKQLKQTQHQFEEYKRKAEIQKSQKTTSRQSYLLKEIGMLKQECAKDIDNLNKYYVTKMDQYEGKIKVYSGLIEQQKLSLLQMSDKINKLEHHIKNQQKERQQLKIKLEQSLVDMCKINEELFKHWLALKDIKTLSLRLSMFDKFQRIYRDIPFDDRMFLL